MAIKYLAGERIIGTAAERAAMTTTSSSPANSWKLLGRTAISGTERDTIDVSITDKVKSNLMVLVHLVQDSANTSANPNFYIGLGYGSIDVGSNYTYRRSHGGSEDSTPSINHTSIGGWGEYGEYFLLMTIRNVATKEKLVFIDSAAAGGLGARAPNRTEIIAKWANTDNQLDKIQIKNTSAGNYGIGSEVVVLGCDDDEEITWNNSQANFWQELATTNLTEASSTLSTGVFTTKKYLWFQVSCPSTSGTADATMQNGNGTIDTGNNYYMKWNIDGGSTGTSGNSGGGNTHHDGVMNLGGSTPAKFGDTFCVNKADKEKLFIPHRLTLSATGSATVPSRGEGVHKWVNTTDQIDIMTYTKYSSQTFAAGSRFRVWGGD